MREDLELTLRRGGINPDSLNMFQRILLTTDGTVTDVLEAYGREPIDVVALSQSEVVTDRAYEELSLEAGQPVLEREILLRGRLSGHNVLHANTIVVPARLGEQLREGLLQKKQPIGHLLLREKLETYREIIRCERRDAAELAGYFGILENAPLLVRTYVVTMERKPIMRITERFPELGM